MAGDCPGPVTPLTRLRPAFGACFESPRAGFLVRHFVGEVPGSGLPHEVEWPAVETLLKSAQAASELERLDTLRPGRSAATARSWRRPVAAPPRSSPAAPALARPPRWPSPPSLGGDRPGGRAQRSGWWPHRRKAAACLTESGRRCPCRPWNHPRWVGGHPTRANLHRLLG